METKAVHCKREPFDVYIGRPSEWGNPFTHKEWVAETRGLTLVESRLEAVYRYRQWILTQPQLMQKLHTLKGKRLGCWCDPEPCHGNVLADLCEGLDSE